MVTALDALQVVNELPNREANGQPKFVSTVGVSSSKESDDTQFQIDVLAGQTLLF
jgi:hypothetical protein